MRAPRAERDHAVLAEGAIQGWESGDMYPSTQRPQSLIAVQLEAGALTAGRELDEAEELWSAVDREAPRNHPPLERHANVGGARAGAHGRGTAVEPLPKSLAADEHSVCQAR